MRTEIKEIETDLSPLDLAGVMREESGLVLLHSALRQSSDDRFSFIAASPFAQLETRSSQCRLTTGATTHTQYGDPWRLMDRLLKKYELLEESDLPFPLGGVFGYWGYELNRRLSTKLASKAARQPDIPDLSIGFYDSLCVFDHVLGKCFIVSTGMLPDGSRSEDWAQRRTRWWWDRIQLAEQQPRSLATNHSGIGATPRSNLSQSEFLERVHQVKAYIQAGDFYQLNLSQRFEIPFEGDCFEFHRRLTEVSPAPYSAFLDFANVQISSASPESFLRISGRHVRTRPIKGTRPRSSDPQRDAQLSFELQSSSKELAELVMITDLLRNDLGRICEFGSVTVPELVRLERFPQVQHLVSTITGQLRPELSHMQALASAFPGGSITGTPKLRAMQVIDELETVARGPYTGAIGYVGFNRESQLNIAIRTAYRAEGRLFFSAGAGIVADSDPAAEYDETLAKAKGFLAALERNPSLPRKPEEREPATGLNPIQDPQ